MWNQQLLGAESLARIPGVGGLIAWLDRTTAQGWADLGNWAGEVVEGARNMVASASNGLSGLVDNLTPVRSNAPDAPVRSQAQEIAPAQEISAPTLANHQGVNQALSRINLASMDMSQFNVSPAELGGFDATHYSAGIHTRSAGMAMG
jgi:hypothetical protein